MIQPVRTKSVQAPVRVVSRWEQLFSEFCACHRQSLNVALHLLTTPLGWLGVIAMIQSVWSLAAVGFAGTYALLLFAVVPARVACRAGAALAGLTVCAALVDLGFLPGLVLVACAYGLQELAHWIADEPTLQSTYADRRGWPLMLATHTFYLLPLVLEAAARASEPPLGYLVPRKRVYAATLESDAEQADLARIAAFVERENPPIEHTTHWWRHDLPAETQAAFERLAESATIRARFRQAQGEHIAVAVIGSMNELYVTGPPRELTSDTVFYTPHIDGPFAVYPFCSVYRCMLAATRNTRVRTHFPMNDGDGSPGHLLTTGEALAFDFNREPHYITSASGPARERRVNLKIHYLVHPRRLGRYGRFLGDWTARYDQRARRLFLDTLKPNSASQRFVAAAIVWLTRLFVSLEQRLGLNNLAYATCLGFAGLLFQNYALFLLATSFVHYLLYIAALRHPRDVCFGRFTRNVVWFKGLAMAQLSGLYVLAGDFNVPSLALLVLGFGLSAAALARLGMTRGYLGAELGQCAPRRVTRFPYNVLPHPMVLGAVVGMVGFHLSGPLREWFPWLVPGHVLAYLGYLLVEVHQTRRMAPFHVANVGARP